MRFLSLISNHDWVRHPLIVDPQSQLSEDDVREIYRDFDEARGPELRNGPPMFLVTPLDASDEAPHSWLPSFTSNCPERVVLARLVKLAERSNALLSQILTGEAEAESWTEVFAESQSALRSFSALWLVDSGHIVDTTSSSIDVDLTVSTNNDDLFESSFTRSMKHRCQGPKALQRKVYRNLANGADDKILLDWSPVDSMVDTLRTRVGSMALFFYNDLCPEVVAILWRPFFSPRAFSAFASEYSQPVRQDGWQNDTLVTLNVRDILRECYQFIKDIVTDTKVIDEGTAIEPRSNKKRTHLKQIVESSSSSNESN
jgi:hypothetical protein